MDNYPHSFTVTLNNIPATVQYAVEASCELRFELSLPDATYSHRITSWKDEGFAELARLFHNSGDIQPDAARFGLASTAADSSLVLSMNDQQKRNLVGLAVTHVMDCVSDMTSEFPEQVLEYAALYTHQAPPPQKDTYAEYIQWHACLFVWSVKFVTPGFDCEKYVLNPSDKWLRALVLWTLLFTAQLTILQSATH
jgi:hypothetical protein